VSNIKKQRFLQNVKIKLKIFATPILVTPVSKFRIMRLDFSFDFWKHLHRMKPLIITV